MSRNLKPVKYKGEKLNYSCDGNDVWKHKTHKAGAYIRLEDGILRKKYGKYVVGLIDPWGNHQSYCTNSKKDAKEVVMSHLRRWNNPQQIKWM